MYRRFGLLLFWQALSKYLMMHNILVSGNYCPYRQMSQPLPCPVGQYTDAAGQTLCKSCNGSVTCRGAAVQARSRTDFQLGQRNRMPLSCPPGTHRDGEGPGCDVCPQGHYCVGGVAIQCPPGTYGPKEGLQREKDCAVCPAGFYCLEGTSGRPSSQFLCPQGYYCEEGTAVPHGSPCPAGTAGGQLGQTSRAACKRCAEGRYCPSGSAGPGLLCARGRYCPAGTVVEVVCPQGTFTPHQGALSVKDCLKCPAGFYCPEGTSDPLPCQPGMFNPLDGQDALEDCRPCYPGKACTQVALKAPDVDCMPGFVCPPGTARPNNPANACPPGTLSNRTDLTDRSQCQQCPARFACLRGTGGIQRPPLSCFAGHYCPAGTMFPTQYKCPAGTWSERSGLESESECRPCPRGWYCLAGVGAPSGRCSSGHYCPEGTMYGTQFPCPRGTYSTKIGNDGREDCVVCPEGYYCKEGTSKPTPCPPTTYRQIKGGQRPEDCSVCPAGYFCPHSATVNPRVCGTGSYSDEGSNECLPCLPGHYCSDETTSEEAMLRVMVCPAGFLCSQGLDREPQRSAVLCPIGFYCPGGGVNPNPIACPNGTYSRQPGLRNPSDCTVCPEGMYCFSQYSQEQPITEPGFYCPEGSSAPEPCEEGTYSSRPALREASECTPCGGGKYCTGVGRTEPSGDCEGGFYCVQRSTSATPVDGQTGGLCPAGSFCPPGSAHPESCPSGTFSNSTGLRQANQCVRCPAGYYCLGSNSTSPTGLCSAGYYCTGGSASPIQQQAEEGHYSLEGAVKAEPCPLGTFQPRRGQSSCIECQPGRRCNLTGLSQQPLCPPGHYCPSGSSTAHPCPPGTYMANPGAEKVQHCGPCDAGQYCHAPGLSAPQGPCEPGFYCSGGANTATPVNFRSGDVCPAGYYCPEGTRHPRQYPCPLGTWSNIVGAQNLSACWPCPAGLFCNNTGLIQPTGVCAAGFYCVSGAKTSIPEDGVTGNRCPAGYFCPQGCTSPQPCPDGTYSNSTGAAECSDCPPGWLCLEGEEAQLCPEGHYCLGGTVEDILPCPPGTYSPKAGQSQVEQCSLCSAGINFKNPDGNFSTGVGGACPIGHYCPEGTSLPLPCPPGTFSNSLYITELSGCSSCPAGLFCGSMGLSRPSGPCQEGFYCPSGATSSTGSGTEGGLCPQAHYCASGSARPLPCPAGTYANLTGQIKCSLCPAGYYCPESTNNYTQFPCPPGFYCPDGTRHATQFPCPRGYYNPEPMTQSLDSCLPCPPGHYCEKERLTAVSGKCKAGWFCVSAAWNPQPFDLDNYTNANCLCPATSTGGRCQAGYYCPSGSSEPIPCPSGTFCNATGYWCPPGQTDDLALPCPVGHHCPPGSPAPVLCPSGTYQDKQKQANCTICEAGFYCDESFGVGNLSVLQPCPKGHYCPKGTSYAMQFPCPTGTYNPREGMDSLSGCLPCPSGHFCPTVGLTEPAGLCFSGYWCKEGSHTASPSAGRSGSLCPVGYYCPKGTVRPVPCPSGTWSNATGQRSDEECQQCPGGFYCATAGLTVPTGLCSEGFYCIEKATTPMPTDRTSGNFCPEGHYCPSGATHPVPCDPGTFMTATQASQCWPCSAGWYCVNGGRLQCPQGFYCPEGTGYDWRPCPLGTYSPESGLSMVSQCRECDGGHYCSHQNATSVSGECSAGYYCSRGNISPQPLTLSAVVDPALLVIIVHKALLSPSLVQRGPLDDCVRCTPGHYCDTSGLTAPTGQCWEGFYCRQGASHPNALIRDHRGGPCPAGYFCPRGSSAPQTCPQGSISSSEGQASCSLCPQGYYCPANGSSAEGIECPTGHYCPTGTNLKSQYPCPAGTINPYTRMASPEDCVPCPPGFFCEASGQNAASGLCEAGYFCLSGAVSPTPDDGVTGDWCPPGHYCPTGSSSPLPCPLGHYSNTSRNTESPACLPCPAGFACSSRGLSAPSHVCHAGYYCPQGQNSSQPPEYTCSPGNMCPPGSPAQIPCASGTYQSLPGQVQIILIQALWGGRGHLPHVLWGITAQQVDSAHLVMPAHIEVLSLPSAPLVPFSLNQLSRPAIRAHQVISVRLVPQSLPQSLRGMETSAQQVITALSRAVLLCPVLLDTTLQIKELLPIAFAPHALQADTAMHLAPPNPQVFALRVTTAQEELKPLLHRPNPFSSDASVTLFHSPDTLSILSVHREATPPAQLTGQHIALEMKDYEGFYCPVGSSMPQPCDAGSHCNQTGLHAPAGLCVAGFYCPKGSLSPYATPCPPGHYCPRGTPLPLPCLPGTLRNVPGGSSTEDCLMCPSGYFCDQRGLTQPSGQCSGGYYCPGGQNSSRPSEHKCRAGHYCEEGSTSDRACPMGSYQPSEGQHKCEVCLAGFFCPQEGFFCIEGSSTAAPVSAVFGDVCPPGHYCNSGSAVPMPCPVGTHRSESGGKSVGDCMPCPGGLFQDQRGQRDCKSCPPGFHCPSSNQQSNGSSAPLICPEGYYCPNETVGRPVPCPKGTYSNNQGLTSADECLVCSLGYYCGSDGLVQPSGPCASGFLCFVRATVPNPTDNNTGSLCPPGVYCQLGVRTGDCSPGYYCDWGSSSPEQRLCPAGFFCPSGTEKPITCAAGTFSSVMGNSERENCEPCPAGYYCQGDGVVEPATCPQGFYCPQGTVMGTEFPCPPGTVQPHAGTSSEEDCLPCPSGMFCALPGLSEPTGRCQDGYLCPPGAISPNATGHRMESAGNNMCPPGHYCPVGTGYPLPCPPGTLSSSPGLSLVEQCQPCPPGHFCEQPAMAHTSDAFLCDAGYVCLGGSRSARPVDGLEGYLCPSGHSCPIGTPVEVPCEPGTYSSAPGAAHCLSCPPGTMCPSSASQEPSPCPKGYFCPAGTATALPCPVGTLGQVTRAQSESACIPCPTGLYCRLPGSSQPQGQCQQGYFCQSGSAYPAPLNTSGALRNGPCPQGHFCPSGTLAPLPCPAGSMRNLSGGYSIESCFPCPAGHYCASEGLDSPSGLCAAGFYCPADFSSTTPHAFLCPKGHYCPLGSPLALPCPTGQYQPNPGSESCIPCRPGFYCEEAIVGDPLPCPPHSYCPTGTMVPQPCPNGTYTLPNVRGLQDEKECLPCPPGRFCRAGQIKGLCAAGYLCVSGSSDFTPKGSVLANRSQCEWGMQCAGPCPAGFYCPEGTELPQACPANTLKETPGGSSAQDCLPCPPRHWCKKGLHTGELTDKNFSVSIPHKGDPMLYMCPVGHYCDGIADYESEGRPGPRECPLFTYRPTPGAGSKGDCFMCPPGTFCNATGLTDFYSFPCPPGYWCSGTGLPVHCPAGTLRAQPGATSASQCEPCAAGTYCPDPRLTRQPNTAGVFCRASYQCPTGSVVETPCRAGSYCRPQTGEPTPCPAGYYCPEGSYTYNTPQQICTYPYYCPVNSSTMLSCGGGFMPRNISGLRVSHNSNCIRCEAGTYRPSHSVHLRCLACPPGYYCPQGAEHYSGQSCPTGYVCPRGSSNPVPCPPGTYGNRTNAELLGACQQCPPGTFNHLNAQRACFPCGSSSTSDRGASSCVCIGKNRVFQHSDGSCLCKTGYVFYNELDFKSSTTDSDLDCQPEVNKRCGAGQVRLASSQECVSPSRYSCNITCGPQGGRLDVGLGICHCERYVSVEEVCNSSCVSTLPELSARFAQDGQLLLRIKTKDESRMWNRNMMNVLGPDSHINNIGKIHFVQFSTQGVFGWVLKDPRFIDTFLSEPFEILEGGPRKKRHGTESELLISGPLPRIPNPIACLNPNDMLIFQLTINYTDRVLSHFPVYQKDHLFSSNPAWDFGAFRRLGWLIKHSQFNSTRFAHVFMEPGKYVFLDNAVPDWSLIVVVRDEGTECDPTAAIFQPTSPAQLVRHGIIKQQHLNLLPDWSAIIGILALLMLLIVVLTVSALLLRPNHASLIGQGRPKPKWRSLGEPNVPVEFVYNGDCSDLLGFRGVGEGAEAEEPSVCKGYKKALIELEEFNVKTLYDKLEDQNLHLASQLAKHRKDTQEFYRNMCQQTDALREALENMEPSKLIQWKKMIDRNSQVKTDSIRVEPWMGLMESVQRSLEAVLCRLNGEAYLQQDSAVTSSHRDTRESELHTGYTQISSADMSELKTRPDTEAASSDPVPRSSTAPCVSEEDLAKLVALTPLTKTLLDIQQSLQALNRPTAEEEALTNPDDTAEGQPAHLIPVALDNLSPRSFAVFLFGCHVVRLLNRAGSFPAVMLLLAKALPVTCTDSLLAYCNKEFYYDASNQILYILESKLQNAGEFVSIVLHSMAYISSATKPPGSAPQAFIKALHLAISALSMQLFHLSFTQEQQKGKVDEESSQLAFGTLVDDFLSVKVPTETHFSQTLLSERLQRYKYFKLEQLLQELKPPPANKATESSGQNTLKMPVQMLCVEQEIEHLNEVYQQLSSQLHRKTHTHSSLEQSQAQLNKGLQEQVVMVKLQQQTVEQRLKEMRERLSKFSSERERAERDEESLAQTAQQTHKESQAFSKHTLLNNGADNQTPATEQHLGKKQPSKHMEDAAGGKDVKA
ncbi:hypothetical protein AOLI_G00293010 [Acnodon oligacanthus]